MPLASFVLAVSLAQDATLPTPRDSAATLRDPFLHPSFAAAIVRRSCAGDGLESFGTEELVLRGLVRTPRGPIALLVGPDERTYFARPGQRVCDGIVEAVTAAGVTFFRHDPDPASPQRPQRSFRPLHP